MAPILLGVASRSLAHPPTFGPQAATAQPPEIVGYVPDPRVPMPSPWKDPGYLQIAWIQSPNFGHRPQGAVVDTIVVHATVIPTLQLTTEAFQRTASQVSSHFTIGKDGSIVQNVSTFDRAWHAGVSTDASGRGNLNHYSVGIELVNLDDGKDPYPDAQIQALCGIIAEMRRRFPIKQLVSHEFIAVPPAGKTTPKAFPGRVCVTSGCRFTSGRTTARGHGPDCRGWILAPPYTSNSVIGSAECTGQRRIVPAADEGLLSRDRVG